MKNLILITSLLVSLNIFAGETRYLITFTGHFTSANHGEINFPVNPHFSPVVLASHDSNFSSFQMGSKASEGLKIVAETGNPTTYINELMELENLGYIFDYKRARGPLNGDETTSIIISVDYDHPLLSVVSMIAPSPDWIVGVSGYSLLENGKFIEKRTIPLYAIDVGTDAGKYFTSSDNTLSVRDPIRLLINVSRQSIKKNFATLEIEKI